ncbi:MAG: DUF4364 family protein [Ruminococcaceae bacterium]|nr:DUF4364 family protein [Oscillospiraceae bacterium]
MQAPLRKKTEIKVYILYVMKNIGYPVDFVHLHDTITADEPVTSFTFTECFSELLDTENVELVRTDLGTDEFIITRKGIHVCDGLLYLLIPGVQQTALKAARRLVTYDQKGIEISSSLTKKDNAFILNLKVVKKAEPIFNMDISLDNETQARLYKEKLEKDPERIYQSILGLLDNPSNYLSIFKN